MVWSSDVRLWMGAEAKIARIWLQTTFRISPSLGRIALFEAGDEQHEQIAAYFFMSRFQQVIRDLGQRDRAGLGVDAVDSMPGHLAKLERQLGNRGLFGVTHLVSFILVARLFTPGVSQAEAARSTQHSSLPIRVATGVASGMAMSCLIRLADL